MPNEQGSFVWYELMTPDPQGAKTFYDEVVGWNVDLGGMGSDDYHLIQRTTGGQAGGVLPLSEEMCQGGARAGWLGYIGVDNVDAAVAAIQTEGGTVMMPAWDTPYGRIAMVTDPQGAPFYLMKPTPPQGQEAQENDVFSPDQPQHVRWNELSTTSPETAVAFYTRHFGWRQEGDMDMGEMGKYQFLYQGERMIGAIMPKMPQMPVSMWSFYIGVDDIDRAAEAVKSGGGQILMGPHEIPGGEFSINGVDPQGAAFGLVGPRKS